jgi:hypothetical protein
MSAVMQWPPVVSGLPLATVRRLQGAIDLELDTARRIRAKAVSTRELLAAHEVVAFYEACLQACRNAVQRLRREAGWPNLGAASPRFRPRPPSAGNCAHAASGSVAAPAAAEPGVSGAKPLTVMGQGWPASSRAGSAAGEVLRSDNALPPSSDAEGHP